MIPGTPVIPGYVPEPNSHWQIGMNSQNHTHMGPPMFQNEYMPGTGYPSLTQP